MDISKLLQVVVVALNEWAPAIQAVSAIVLAVITYVYVRLTGSLASASNLQAEVMAKSIEEMRKTREAQARAYVTLELWPWDRNFNMFDLAIRNYGPGAARDICIRFDEEIPWTAHAGKLNDLEVLRGLPFLAPHDAVIIFLGNRDQISGSESKLEIWKGDVRFTDDVGTHETKFKINLKEFDKLEWPFPGGEPPGAPPIRYGWGRTGPLPERPKEGKW